MQLIRVMCFDVSRFHFTAFVSSRYDKRSLSVLSPIQNVIVESMASDYNISLFA
jgi:hypothetical protein